MNIDELLRDSAPDEAAMRHESARMRDSVLANLATAEEHPDLHVLPRVRRRRVLARVAIGAAALAIVSTGVTMAVDGGAPASAAQQRFTGAAPAPAYDTYGAFSAGNTVYIGNHSVTFDEKIKAMYYTSEGVLVRMGKVDYTDDAGPSHYSLIRPDGSYTSIDLQMGDRVVATDPGSPNVAYAEPTGSRWSFVVINLVTGKEVARTTVDGAFTWGGWEAPPVTMSGDRMWALFDEGWMEYDWESGTTRLVPDTKNAIVEAAHGRTLVATDSDPEAVSLHWAAQDLATDAQLQKVTIGPDSPSPSISPDGRFVRIQSHYTGYNEHNTMIQAPGPFTFVDIDSGATVELKRNGPLGWTPGGNTLEVDAKADRLMVCSPSTGKCDRIDLPISGTGKVKLGGASYES